MTCDEFERVLPELGGDRNLIEHDHLKTCSQCVDLVSDLNAISDQAARLGADLEPGPRVWNSIEAALRQEGLIRDPKPQLVLTVAKAPSWRYAWLVPIAAALVFGAGLLFIHQHAPLVQQASSPATQPPTVSVAQPIQVAMPADEDQLLQVISARAPTMRATYETNLRAVNAYIRDAESSVQNNPNDEIAQQHLMSAYEQRAMVYEMAMDRAIQ
jgi:hypothetical protein